MAEAELTHASTSRIAKAAGLTLHYHEAGPGDGHPAPVVIMLHGGGPGASGWSNFGRNLPVFAEHFRTLLVDQPCYGRSDKPELDKDYFSYSADAVAALMDELGIERAHFVGNSLGGGTAVRMALNHPGKVAKLLLMGPGGVSVNLFAPDPTEGIKRLFEFSASPEPTKDQLRAFLGVMSYDPSIVTDELVEERWASANDPDTRLGNARMGASFAEPAWAEDVMLWREAHRITQPVLLTWGREDRVNPLDGAFVALKTIPDARLHVFPHCGHWAQVERADEFNRLALDFFSH
ncbi:4,5:9,10-diseco-3-hydroxy-5,9,17-trioxoandrosta-1(10),2-diene-4-oate hydrolase [Streptomyces gardneri]|uniref:4,5-9,10-diseco-3-hydroxy-5,9,17-trioxoandrosta-1 (10),2-diene-4-oate hydrolase n=1 Tax=Streptomyces gardneri TaxID=66892 RepID=A0A4Y3RGL3_9ACTN|nr:4,5:9,10-diseco-3-hydroxy-5,9,17-trioxoandrosta-1(10),2-diene-4-oate hydrolase [Streptomyces gardneri]GEB55813.1 4,5-9,10-diseco-3-hydroxy-5,9,17-trioxoandrosta-1 (10),2-diene-4-oate hydrolase [Streptomyces gardneri]GHH08408.1 4,5-9,10-diseco-3-hydroxy-5,9,17-trioxoandrosta-1(10),2-diene-4-oate hydrolase [Streptomyces gardneri]